MVISGCSGGGKSTLLAELGRRGHATIEEPGRRIVREELTGERALGALGRRRCYHRRVFLAPPWPEIYERDAERRHDFEAGKAEYHRLLKIHRSLGYDVTILPKMNVGVRAEFVLGALAGR
ncbi:MAG TPA: AAA family ATPase [Caulobacteraceae bacterium]